MENPIEKKTIFFRGAGYLIGFFIGTVTAVIFVAITGIEALIGAIAGAVAIPAGIVLEEKLQGKERDSSAKAKSSLIAFIVLGIVFLSVAIILTI